MCTSLDKAAHKGPRRQYGVSWCGEFARAVSENPFHPVAAADYPRLLDHAPTARGMSYLGRLLDDWSAGGDEPSGMRRRHLGVLHLAYAAASSSIAECRMWEARAFLDGMDCEAEDPEAEAELMQMGCLRDNEGHDPKLYKSHLLWRERALAPGRRLLAGPGGGRAGG